MEGECRDCCNPTEDVCENCGEPCCCGDQYYSNDLGNCYLCENCGQEVNGQEQDNAE